MEDDIRFVNNVFTVSLFVILFVIISNDRLQNKNHLMAKTLSPIKENKISAKKSLFAKQIKSLKHKIDKLNYFIKNFKKEIDYNYHFYKELFIKMHKILFVTRL